jgi:transposase-like protein
LTKRLSVASHLTCTRIKEPARSPALAAKTRQWSSEILERGGKIRTKVVSSRKKHALQSEVRKHVEAGSNVYSDALKSYEGMDEYCHQFVDHAVEYIRGNVHTNGLENFWSLLKRSLNGTYVSVEPFHLLRYLDEQAFRLNRKDEDGELVRDADRFGRLILQICGRRLTYSQMTGKELEKPAPEAF